jgi:hypothetical protein
MFCDSETLTSPVETTQCNFKSRSAWGNVWVIFVPCVVHRKLLRTIMSKKGTCMYHHFCHQWTEESWVSLHLSVFSIPKDLEMYMEAVLSLSFCLGQPLHLPDHLVRYVHPWIRCNWLFFHMSSYHTHHCEICHSQEHHHHNLGQVSIL